MDYPELTFWMQRWSGRVFRNSMQVHLDWKESSRKTSQGRNTVTLPPSIIRVFSFTHVSDQTTNHTLLTHSTLDPTKILWALLDASICIPGPRCIGIKNVSTSPMTGFIDKKVCLKPTGYWTWFSWTQTWFSGHASPLHTFA